MNKLMTKIMVCAFLVLATSISNSADSTSSRQVDQTQPEKATVTIVNGKKIEVVVADVNRGDPFGGGGFGDAAESQSNVITGIDSMDAKPKPPLVVRTVSLKFLNAANLKAAIDKMSSANGSISVNESTNSLIVCDTEENVKRIIVEIQKADLTPKQIMIEVVIIDVQLKDDTEIGVDWDILSSDNKDFSYRQNMIYPNRMSVIAPTADTIASMTAYQNVGLASGGEVALVTNDIRNVLHFLQEKRSVDILASPRVMVVSGQKASIKTIEEIPYQEITQSSAGGGGTNAITSTQFKDVGVTMDVKAVVTDEGKV